MRSWEEVEGDERCRRLSASEVAVAAAAGATGGV